MKQKEEIESKLERTIKTKGLCLRLSPKMHKEVIKHAKRLNTTQSDLVRACVDLWLENQK